MDFSLMRDIELQLRQAAEEIRRKNHNGWGNACEQAADALANALDDLAAERARADAAVAEAAEHKLFREESARRLRECRAHRDRLRAAGRALLACPHIAERDTDPDWVDAEAEAAVAEMRAALKEGGSDGRSETARLLLFLRPYWSA